MKPTTCLQFFHGCGFVTLDGRWSINRILIKDVIRIFEYLCLEYHCSFTDQRNDWVLQNGDFRLIKKRNVKLARMIINSTALTNTYLLSNICEKYSCSATCNNEIPFLRFQTLLLYLHQFIVININVSPSQISAIVLCLKYMVVTILEAIQKSRHRENTEF